MPDRVLPSYRTGHVQWVYLAIGVVTFLIPIAFAFTPLGHAEKYVDTATRSQTSQRSPANADGPAERE